MSSLVVNIVLLEDELELPGVNILFEDEIELLGYKQILGQFDCSCSGIGWCMVW